MWSRSKTEEITIDWNSKIKVGNKPSKREIKVQEDFIQWLRHMKNKTEIFFRVILNGSGGLIMKIVPCMWKQQEDEKRERKKKGIIRKADIQT